MDDDIAIKIKGVYKDFKLPHEKINSLKNVFTNSLSYIRKRRTFETQHALKDIDLDIKKGEFFGIVGRNGSGKSTLLKILAGIYQPTKGKASVNGKLVPFIELGVGFNPELTGRENVYLNGALLGFSQKEVEEKYEEIVNFAELEEFMDQKLKNYSSGMQVRLAFSMAVRAKADILLIDEVLAVGDVDFQRKCFDYFKKLKLENTTVVFVSHDMDAVGEYCDRAMLIEKNQVIMTGNTNKVAEEYMKLFTNVSIVNKARKSSSKRWGDESILVDSVDVTVNEKEISIKMVNKAHKNIDNPISGFRIRDKSGKHITGTNTKIEKVRQNKTRTGKKFTVEWKFPNLLSDGEYLVDVAVLRADNVTVCDWWDKAAAFKIHKSRHLPYIIDPGFKTSIV